MSGVGAGGRALAGQVVKITLRMASRAAFTKKITNTRGAPAAIGPYSQAVQVDNTLYLSGQIGMDPQSGELVSDDVSKQAKQALDNLGAVLKAAGADYQNGKFSMGSPGPEVVFTSEVECILYLTHDSIESFGVGFFTADEAWYTTLSLHAHNLGMVSPAVHKISRALENINGVKVGIGFSGMQKIKISRKFHPLHTVVVKATVLLADINDFTKVNDVYAQYFTCDEPARAAYQAAALPKGAKVEIEAIACMNTTTKQ